MMYKTNRILTAALAILIIASISACSDSPTNSSTSKTSSDTTSSVVDIESSVPETSVTDTSVPETTVHTEDTSIETPKPETTVTTTTTTAVTTKPAPEWTETKVSGTKYVNTSCYSRRKAVLGAETVALYNVNDKVTVTAKTDTGYFKLSDGSFIHSDYLSDSKVTIQTTTTTVKKQESPSQSEKVNLTVYTAQNDVSRYDANGELKGFFPYYGSKVIISEALKDKGLYRINGDYYPDFEYDGGVYIKISDTINTDPIEKVYHYPFDINAIRQAIIEDGENNYGLIHDDAPECLPENSTWFAPSVIDKTENPAKIKQDLASLVSFSFNFGGMQAGDTFKIYIEKIPYERAKNFGYGYNPSTGELAYSKEEFEQLDAYAIYFFRGGNSNPND